VGCPVGERCGNEKQRVRWLVVMITIFAIALIRKLVSFSCRWRWMDTYTPYQNCRGLL
jgi:hypothetical protein